MYMYICREIKAITQDTYYNIMIFKSSAYLYLLLPSFIFVVPALFPLWERAVVPLWFCSWRSQLAVSLNRITWNGYAWQTERNRDRQTDSEAVGQVTEPGACQDITGYVQQQQHQLSPAATRDETGNKTPKNWVINKEILHYEGSIHFYWLFLC